MKGKNNKVTVRKGNLHRLFFIKPEENSDINHAVERLLGLSGIAEVLISDGDYGLIVKACYSDSSDDNLRNYIARNYKGRFSEAVCHYRCIR
ncbi:MAG: hypothetical protein KGH72_05995 [Candidatus Micrarchaeota archaeon]|nr:hypothetical protein [Candidatus Micrarchaeota archaeon]